MAEGGWKSLINGYCSTKLEEGGWHRGGLGATESRRSELIAIVDNETISESWLHETFS